jgi:hypothetical protein
MKKITTEEFINECNKKHNNKYEYRLTNYTGYYSNITVICKIHGTFKQRAGHHLEGRGCQKCGIDRCKESKFHTKEEFIEKSNKIHNNFYNYDKVIYIKARNKVCIVCPKHGEYWQSPDNHLHGRGCYKCKNSKGEKIILLFLIKNNIVYINQKMFDDCRNPKTNHKLRYDFFIPSKNILIEYDGKQHFKSGKFGKTTYTVNMMQENQFRDDVKTKYAKNNNIKLLRIKYTDYKNIEEILINNLL